MPLVFNPFTGQLDFVGAAGAGGPPSGPAGGDLSGTYPNPSVSSINGNLLGLTTPNSGALLIGSGVNWVTQAMSGDATLGAGGALTLASTITAGGPTGDATHVPRITYDAKGRLTAVSSVAISGVAPGGAAGGDLSGTYPNPTVSQINGVAYSADPLAQYMLLSGRSGGQVGKGGTGTGDSLTLRGSSGATQPLGSILLNDDVSGRVGIGTASPVGWLDVTAPAITGIGTISSSGTIVTLTQSGGQPLWNTPGNSGQLHQGDVLTAGGISAIVSAVVDDTTVILVAPAPVPAWSGASYTFSPPILRTTSGAITGLFVTGDGRLGVRTIAPTALFQIAAPATPSSSSTSNGTPAVASIGLSGGNAGATSLAGATGGTPSAAGIGTGGGGANTAANNAGNAGGNGGALSLSTGNGGSVTNGGLGCTPGIGGALALTGGIGGNISSGAGGSTAGKGASLTFTGGNGGTAVAGNTTGPGGDIIINAGNAGGGAGTAGTKGQVRIGLVNASPVNIGTGGLRIGDATAATAYVDVVGKLLVDSNGNLTKLNNVVTNAPGANATGLLHNDGAGTWSWSLVSLTADVSGVLPVGNLPAVGGDLTGTVTNATVAKINGASLGTTTATSGKVLIADGAAWQSVALSGDATVVSSGALTLADTIAAGGPVGDATHVPQITYDSKGRLTAVSSVAISGAPPTSVSTTVTVEPEASYKSFTITDANVNANSRIFAQVYDELDPVICDTHARAGSFDLTLSQTDPESNGFLKGIYKIQYLIAA